MNVPNSLYQCALHGGVPRLEWCFPAYSGTFTQVYRSLAPAALALIADDDVSTQVSASTHLWRSWRAKRRSSRLRAVLSMLVASALTTLTFYNVNLSNLQR